jgi:hypothetical protein
MKTLDHPHIIRLLEAIDTPDEIVSSDSSDRMVAIDVHGVFILVVGCSCS